MVNTFDFRHVERAARVAEEQCARHFELRHRLIAAFNDGARAARNDLPALQQTLDLRVILPLLECLERFEARIFVIKTHDKADIYPIMVEVIDKAAAVDFVIQRPPERVLDEARVARARAAIATIP